MAAMIDFSGRKKDENLAESVCAAWSETPPSVDFFSNVF